MAIFYGNRISDGTARWYVEDLQYPANDYDYFAVSTSDGKYVEWSSSFSGFTTNNTTSGHNCGITVTGTGTAVRKGIGYPLGSASVTMQACPVPPPAPTNLRATDIQKNSISAAWNAASGATSYDIYRNDVYQTTTSSTSYTHSGLNPSTSYKLSVISRNAAGAGGGTSINVTTLADTSPPSTPSPPSASRFEGGFTASWGSVAGATSYTLRAVRTYDSDTRTFNTSSTSQSVTGQFGVAYSISVQAHNQYGSSSYSGTSTITVAPQIPTIAEGAGSSTSISVVASVSSGNVTDIQVERYSTTNVYIDTRTISGSGGTATWTGLTMGSKYNFKARSRYNVSGSDIYSVGYSATLTLTVGGSRPNNFAWQYSTVSVGAKCEVDHRDFNNLAIRINEFRAYKGLTSTTITSASSGADITSSIYNSARNALSALSTYFTGGNTIPSTKVKDVDAINASDFNRLRDSLNSIL